MHKPPVQTKAQIHTRHLARLAEKASRTHGRSKHAGLDSKGGPHHPNAGVRDLSKTSDGDLESRYNAIETKLEARTKANTDPEKREPDDLLDPGEADEQEAISAERRRRKKR